MGSAIELPFLEHVDGVLETWLLGQEASEAIADELFWGWNSLRAGRRIPSHIV